MSDTQPFALVVDDDAVILSDACGILEEAGFRTLSAMSVDEAEHLLEAYAGAITILFTDVEMPGGRDGFDLARLSHERWPNIAVLVASGRAEPEASDLPEGVTFIRKPFSSDVVHTRLQEMLPDGEMPEPLRQARVNHVSADESRRAREDR